MFEKNKQEVQFFAKKQHIEVFPHPSLASKFLPHYFQRLKPQTAPDPKSGTVKRCVHFLDAMTQGYIIPLWCDVYVKAYDGEISLIFPENLPMETSLSPHGYEQIRNHPLSNSPYGNIPMKWHNPWGVKTESGWSCLFTSPLNHLETRFKILDGVVDTDTYYNQVNFPFIWTGGDGEFFIEEGTPLVQVIPFKRLQTKCDIVEQDDERQQTTTAKLGTKLRNAYRTMFWHKNRTK